MWSGYNRGGVIRIGFNRGGVWGEVIRVGEEL